MGKKNTIITKFPASAENGAATASDAHPSTGEAGPAGDSPRSGGSAVLAVQAVLTRPKRATKSPAPAKVGKSPRPAADTGAGASKKKSAPGFTRDEIALRAYFIAEKRRARGLPGDEHQDWIEAERQLAAKSRSAKKTRTS
jgi:hypothetical protein